MILRLGLALKRLISKYWRGLFRHCEKSVQIWSFFWSVFSPIRTECGLASYSVSMRENTDKKKLLIWTLFTQWRLCQKFIKDSFLRNEKRLIIFEKKASLLNFDYCYYIQHVGNFLSYFCFAKDKYLILTVKHF